MDRVYGVVIALVTDVDDPRRAGPGQADAIPWLAEEGTDSGWAPIARPMAGKDRGFYYLPEVDDEALVAFEHGDVDHPMVLGFLHNGVDMPPDEGIDEHVRRLKSVVRARARARRPRRARRASACTRNDGHQLELHDRERPRSSCTPPAARRSGCRTTRAQIELATVGGTTVTLDDSPSQVELTTTAGVTVTDLRHRRVSRSRPAGPVDGDQPERDASPPAASVHGDGAVDVARRGDAVRQRGDGDVHAASCSAPP